MAGVVLKLSEIGIGFFAYSGETLPDGKGREGSGIGDDS